MILMKKISFLVINMIVSLSLILGVSQSNIISAEEETFGTYWASDSEPAKQLKE